MSTMENEELLAWKPRMGVLTVAEKIEQAEMIKKQANLRFQRGEIKKALPIYAKVRPVALLTVNEWVDSRSSVCLSAAAGVCVHQRPGRAG